MHKAYIQTGIQARHRISPGEIGLIYFHCKTQTIFIRYETTINGVNIMTVEFYHHSYQPWNDSKYIRRAEHDEVFPVWNALKEKAGKMNAAIRSLTLNGRGHSPLTESDPS